MSNLLQREGSGRHIRAHSKDFEMEINKKKKAKVWNTQWFQQVFTKPELAFIPELNPEILSNIPLRKRDRLSSYLKLRRMHHLPNLKAEMNAVNCPEETQMYSLVGWGVKNWAIMWSQEALHGITTHFVCNGKMWMWKQIQGKLH